MTKRITIDASPLLGQRTGVGESVALLTQAFAEANLGHREIHLWGNSLKGDLPAEMAGLPSGMTARRTRLPHRYLLRAWEKLNWPPVDLLAGKCDLFHATNFYPPPAKHAKSVVTIHDLYFMHSAEYGQNLGGAWFREVLPKSLSRVDAVIAPSQATADDVRTFFPSAADRVHVVPWGLSSLSTKPRRKPPSGPFNILAVGTIEPRKNYRMMIDVATQLKDRNILFQLNICGGLGWGFDLEETIRKRNLSSHMTHLGYQSSDTLQRLSSEADLFISTSINEGFCLPLLHAMRHGTPSVVTDGGALPGVAGNAATVVPVNDVEAFTDAVVTTLTDTAEWQRRSDASLNRAADFTLGRLASGTLAVYDAVLGG